MADFNPNPYRGEASIPHVNEEFFKVYFIGAQLALGFLLMPGRILGSEMRPRRYNRDLVMAACDEAARKREARRGKIPTQAMVRGDWEARMWERWVCIVLTPCMADLPSVLAQWRPYAVTDSWPHRWHRQLHWRSWMQERMGGGGIKQN